MNELLNLNNICVFVCSLVYFINCLFKDVCLMLKKKKLSHTNKTTPHLPNFGNRGVSNCNPQRKWIENKIAQRWTVGGQSAFSRTVGAFHLALYSKKYSLIFFYYVPGHTVCSILDQTHSFDFWLTSLDGVRRAVATIIEAEMKDVNAARSWRGVCVSHWSVLLVIMWLCLNFRLSTSRTGPLLCGNGRYEEPRLHGAQSQSSH